MKDDGTFRAAYDPRKDNAERHRHQKQARHDRNEKERKR